MAHKYKDHLTISVLIKTILTWTLVGFLISIEFTLFMPFAILLTLIFDMKQKRIIFAVTKLFIRLFFTAYLIGKFNIQLNNLKKPKGPRIYVLNHASQFDTFLMYLLPGSFKVFVKHEYTKLPFIGWTILLTGNILIKKLKSDHAESDVIAQGIKKIKQGHPLIIFPEGTKSKTGDVGRFKAGAFKIAYDTKAEIVPVVLDSWNSIRPGGGGWIRDNRVWLKVLNTYTYNDYKDMDVKIFAKKLRIQIWEELVDIRKTRCLNEKNYYRNNPFFIEYDKNIMEKINKLKNSISE